MRFGIRKKLVTTYILAIIIPVGVIMTLFAITDAYMNSRGDLKGVGSDYGVVNKVITLVESNYKEINDYDKFYKKVLSELKGKNNKIVIVDNHNNLLFHSKDKEGTMRQATYKIPEKHYYDIEAIDKRTSVIRLVAPLVEENKVVGKMELTLDRFQLDMNIINQILKFMVLIFLTGVLVLIFLIVLFTSVVSKGVIMPLKKLSEAAENIAKGNLEQEITYNKNDEFGQFSRVFDSMRVKLKESLEKQRELENARKELVASISHDLRTPITSIKGYVEAINDGKIQNQEQLQKYLYIVKDKTEKLDRLIDDLFQFSQLELGKLKMNKVVWNSRDLMENVLGGYFFEFENLGIELNIEEPIPSVNLNIDEYFISRVFDNILQNAKKYVGEGGTITIKSSLQGDDFQITIKDNGEGIKSEDLPNIFNRFYRGEKSRSREYGGAGLGLSICKQIIEDHGGRIWVESVYGEGSAFHFSLPIKN